MLALQATRGDDPSLGRRALREVAASDADGVTREGAKHALHRIQLAVLAAPKRIKRRSSRATNSASVWSKRRRDSYAACVDQSCQIALGQAVAANKSLATKILQALRGDRVAAAKLIPDA